MDLLLSFAPYQQYMEGVGMDALPNFRFCYHFPVQQTNFGIGLRFKYVVHLFGLATNMPYAEYEKTQKTATVMFLI